MNAGDVSVMNNPISSESLRSRAGGTIGAGNEPAAQLLFHREGVNIRESGDVVPLELHRDDYSGCKIAHEHLEKGCAMVHDVVIMPTFALVEDARKRRADAARAGSFAQTITTFNAWIADLWELHGDGRAIVDSVQRELLMRAAFDETLLGGGGASDDGLLTASPGVVRLASSCVKMAAGVPAFERAVDEAAAGHVPDGLSGGEAALLAGIAAYRDLLGRSGFVEAGLAASLLSGASERVFPRTLNVLVDRAAPLDWRMEAFFEACGNVHAEVRLAPGARGIGRMPDGVDVRFGFPSGRYAQAALVADVLRGATCGAGDGKGGRMLTVVTAADPLSLYEQLEPALAESGFVGYVQARVPFSQTDFGRRFLALVHALEDDRWMIEDLSDSLRSPFSGLALPDMLSADAALRGNRLVQRDEFLGRLRAASDTFSQLEELATSPDADVLIGVFEQIAFTAPDRSDAWRSEQLAAAGALRACMEAARSTDGGMAACADVLENVSVTVSYESCLPEGAHEGGRVLVTSQPAAAQMGAGSCARLVMCDLTLGDYSVAERGDAAVTLFAKLGLDNPDTALARARRTFTALQSLPTDEIVFVRPLNDWDGAPTYPAAMLQEFVDAYRAGEADRGDKLTGLPAALRGHAVMRGEELLFANACARSPEAAQPIAAELDASLAGKVNDANASTVALPCRGKGGRVVSAFSPSPSQVESYLECPYKWFAQSRVNIEVLDEGFGALERGSFAHAALQEFYVRFIGLGNRKVTTSNLGEAKRLMRTVVEELAALQPELEPGKRYAAANQVEQRELETCKDQLVAYLDFEAAFLPTFHPAHFEFEIAPEDGIRYAGCDFIGKVDRIDVDDKGHAVIVDYKGSAGAQYEIAGTTPEAPGKVQTRVYARAVERALGVEVVGALYVSYGRDQGCAGAYDGRVIETAWLPAMRHDRCCCALESPPIVSEVQDYSQLTFSDMLDETERVVERVVADMREGRVEPDPVSPDACTWCPVEMCQKRGA